ncbi:MAG TPA: serine hydrolase domain-containing protein [Longimicrobiales bacterium]
MKRSAPRDLRADTGREALPRTTVPPTAVPDATRPRPRFRGRAGGPLRRGRSAPRRARLAVLLLAGTTLAPLAPRAALAQVPALAPAPARYVAAIDQARDIIRALIAEHAIPGVSAAVAVDGRVVWSEGFGYADLENRVPVTPLTRFRIGSVSKSVTSAAIGKLYEQGRLDLDAPVQRYVPSFPEKRWPITTRQLGGHLAGIRHYRGDEFLNATRYPTVTAGLEIFEDDSLLFQPGTDYSYSSYGWNLISAVIEGASGMDFLTYMRREIFAPLQLRSIVAGHTDSIIRYRASFYERDRETGRVLNAPYVDNSNKWAGGGFLSNTEDLVRFGSALLDGTFLRAETVELLFTSQKTTSGEETGYGIGWFSGTDDAGRRWVGHTGGSVGGRAVLVLYPEEGVVVAALANLGSAPMSIELGQRLAAGFIQDVKASRP